MNESGERGGGGGRTLLLDPHPSLALLLLAASPPKKKPAALRNGPKSLPLPGGGVFAGWICRGDGGRGEQGTWVQSWEMDRWFPGREHLFGSAARLPVPPGGWQGMIHQSPPHPSQPWARHPRLAQEPLAGITEPRPLTVRPGIDSAAAGRHQPEWACAALEFLMISKCLLKGLEGVWQKEGSGEGKRTSALSPEGMKMPQFVRLVLSQRSGPTDPLDLLTLTSVKETAPQPGCFRV